MVLLAEAIAVRIHQAASPALPFLDLAEDAACGLAIDLDLPDQVVNILKTLLVPESRHKLDHEIAAMDVLVKVEYMGLYSPVTLIECWSDA